MTADSTFPITGIPKAKDAEWIRHNTPENGKKIPYVQNIPVRYEITEWFMKVDDSGDGSELKKQWTLFILALEKFMQMEIKDKLSYFQVAGIHGFPLQPWDNAPGPVKGGDKPGDNPEDGYCHHNTVAFPTWHRPYMMLFEQCIWLNMMELIDDKNPSNPFQSEKDKWKTAADNWRFPYWDWARKQKDAKGDMKYAYPIICTVPEIKIWHPTEGLKQHPNPLAKFECPEKDANGKPVKFGEISDKDFRIKDDPRPIKHDGELLPWGQCSATSRYGILSEVKNKGPYTGLEGLNESVRGNLAIANATENFYYMKPGVEKKPPKTVKKPSSLGDAVIRMFSEEYNKSWGEFASTKWYKEEALDIDTGYMSLEYIHNNLHNLSGGGRLRKDLTNEDDNTYGLGHMSEVPVAAFDPIFWLHHGNVDRLCAMWQVLYWEKWWDSPEPKEKGKKTYVRVDDKKPDEALEPFHQGTKEGKAVSWTSNACRDWTVGGYTYDDLVPPVEVLESPNGPLNEKHYKRWLRYRIMSLYDSTADVALKLLKTDSPATIFGNDVASRTDIFQDYLLNIVYDRYALDGLSYSIKFYLSNRGPDDISTAMIETNENDLVGEVYSFGGGAPATDSSPGCANCSHQQAAGTLSKAQIPITVPLLLRAEADRLGDSGKVTRKNVDPFLRQNLTWKYTCYGVEIGEEKFPQTGVKVYAGLTKSVPVQQEESASFSYMNAGLGGQELFSTPLFGVEDGAYRELFDAVDERHARLQQEAQGGNASFAAYSINSGDKYTDDDW